MNQLDLLTGLMNLEKVDDVRQLIEGFLAVSGPDAQWLPVGGRPNNSGTIQAASDPARALVERITNAIDAVIERAHIERNGRPECSTPKEAVEAWFGVPSKGLHELSATARRNLAENAVTVVVNDGDGKAKRCVEIADKGIGLTANDLPRTILSLNESNKLSKFYLAGAFGQGGSATFAISDYTLVASKAMGTGLIAFSIVTYEPPQGVKLGSYVYLALGGTPLVVEDDSDILSGFATLVRHYGYDLSDYPSPLGPNSVYGRCQTVLFEPVLPFMLEDRIHTYRRTMKGSRTALNGAVEE